MTEETPLCSHSTSVPPGRELTLAFPSCLGHFSHRLLDGCSARHWAKGSYAFSLNPPPARGKGLPRSLSPSEMGGWRLRAARRAVGVGVLASGRARLNAELGWLPTKSTLLTPGLWGPSILWEGGASTEGHFSPPGPDCMSSITGAASGCRALFPHGSVTTHTRVSAKASEGLSGLLRCGARAVTEAIVRLVTRDLSENEKPSFGIGARAVRPFLAEEVPCLLLTAWTGYK